MEDPRYYKIALALLPGTGPGLAKNLVAYLGSLEQVFRAKRRELLRVPGIGSKTADLILQADVRRKAEKELEFIDKRDIKIVSYLDKEYPSRLKECSDCPLILFQKGQVNYESKKAISIVGTRRASRRAIDFCSELIKGMVEKGYRPLIISGLAYGIDIEAHKSALSNQLETIAVLGHGLDIIYPAMHKKYAREIQYQGALITEFLSGSPIDRNNFVKRNRIIAGLSDATLVIESARKGGALITADIAYSYNRDVLAVPGRWNDEMSKGCNYLIKTNQAALMENLNDLEFHLNWEAKSQKHVQKQLLLNRFTPDEQRILTCIKEGISQIDMIKNKTQIPVNELSTQLLKLELEGIIKAMPGKVYTLLNYFSD